MEDCPDPQTNFREWLKFQKQNWRKIRSDLKLHKQIQRDVTMKPEKKGGLASFVRSMDDVILNSTWHVVSIESTYEPGVLRLWASTPNSQMFSVKVRVPRVVYLNSKITTQHPEFKPVTNLVLPRNRQTFNLYQWSTGEEVYQENFNKIEYDYLLNN